MIISNGTIKLIIGFVLYAISDVDPHRSNPALQNALMECHIPYYKPLRAPKRGIKNIEKNINPIVSIETV